MQALNHALLFGRQIGDHAVQEQCGLVEQAFGRFHALDHDRARHGVQPRVFLRRKLAAGEHHDRQVHQRRLLSDLLQHVEAGHIGQAQVEHHAIDQLLAQQNERLLAGFRRHDVDIVAAQQLRDAEPLGGVVLDHQQAAATRRGEILDARERLLQSVGAGRLAQEGERAARQTVLAILIESNDLHRDVARRGVLLELAQHAPAQHVGQENIERDGGGLVFARQRQRLGAPMRHQRLEARTARQIDQDAGMAMADSRRSSERDVTRWPLAWPT